MIIGTLAVDGWVVTFGTARRGLGGAPARPLLAVPNVTAHPSTASVPTSLLFNVALLSQDCEFACTLSLVRPGERRLLSVSSLCNLLVTLLRCFCNGICF